MTLLNPAFRTVRLGNERTGIQVQLLAFPGTDSPLLDKVQAFAYFEEIIREHRPQLTTHAVKQAYADNIPVSSSASAAEEADRVNSRLLAPIFHVSNLTCLGFFKLTAPTLPSPLNLAIVIPISRSLNFHLPLPLLLSATPWMGPLFPPSSVF